MQTAATNYIILLLSFVYINGINYSDSSVRNRRGFFSFLPKQSQESSSSYRTDLDLWNCFGAVKHVL